MSVAGQGSGAQENSATLWQICREILKNLPEGDIQNLPKGDIQTQPMQDNSFSIAAGVQALFYRTVPFSYMELLDGHYFCLIFFQAHP